MLVLQAENLGDSVAIMSGGCLRIQGTPLQLKLHFGIGYELVCLDEGEGGRRGGEGDHSSAGRP